MKSKYIVAARGNLFVAVRHGEVLPPDVLKEMSQKMAAFVAVRARHPESIRSDVIRSIRGIVSQGEDEKSRAHVDQVFAGAMSFPPYIHQLVLRLAGENRGLTWTEIIRRVSERYILRTISSRRSQSVGGGSFARSKIVSTFRKEAVGRGKDKLRDEIDFLNRLPDALRPIYPAVLSTEEPDQQSLVMNQEFVGWPTVRAHLLHEGTDVGEIIERLRALMHHLKSVSYDVGTLPTPSDYIDRMHFQRVSKRIELTCEMCPPFRALVDAREIVINGKSYMNVPEALSSIERARSMRGLVTPSEVSPLAHGDLHLENILFDAKSPDAKLVDPRGYEFCDIYYDLGKLSHSVNGKYDLIHEGLFALVYQEKDGVVEASLGFTDDEAVRMYDSIHTHLRVWCSELTSDDRSLGRMLFNEAMHFTADMPFHLTGDGKENRAVAIYLTAVMLLNRFRDEWL